MRSIYFLCKENTSTSKTQNALFCNNFLLLDSSLSSSVQGLSTSNSKPQHAPFYNRESTYLLSALGQQPVFQCAGIKYFKTTTCPFLQQRKYLPPACSCPALRNAILFSSEQLNFFEAPLTDDRNAHLNSGSKEQGSEDFPSENSKHENDHSTSRNRAEGRLLYATESSRASLERRRVRVLCTSRNRAVDRVLYAAGGNNKRSQVLFQNLLARSDA